MISPERYIEVKRVYLGAERLPKGERSRFIRAQCGDDSTLEAQVRQLLTAEEQQPDFLETPPLAGRSGLSPGSVVGAFTVVRLLGEGGMGIVYEAQQDEPRRSVALKIIRSGGLSERLRSRFRHEIRVLGQLRHPGIAQIYEAGTLTIGSDHVPYFAMELVTGPPLLRFAEQHTLGDGDRLAIIAQICDAVHHAHQKGVIHRDLKPGNILVEDAASNDGSGTAAPMQVKILDFGISRLADTQAMTVQTEPGQLIGTLPYMSPEQVSGTSDAVDIRSDVYSIGIIAFELLSGKLPYAVREAPLPEAVRVIHDVEPARLGSLRRELRGDVETIVAKALEKDPKDRYQSAAELAADIRRFLRDEPILARPASALYQIRKFARRHRPLVAAVGIVVLTMACATVVSVWQAGIAIRARSLAEDEQRRADRSADSARRLALRATLAAVDAAVESGDPISARRLLDATNEASRGWAWRYWNSRLDQCISVASVTSPIAGAWISPGGDEVAVLTRDGALSRGDPGGPEPIATLAGVPCFAAAFTQDGARVVAITGSSGRSLDTFDARTGILLKHIGELEAAGRMVDVSADGETVLAAVKRYSGTPYADNVWIWNGDQPSRPVQTKLRTTYISLSADGGRGSLGFYNARMFDTETLAFSLDTEELPAWLRGSISDDGSLLAAGGEDKIVRVWKPGRSSPLELRGHTGSITAVTFDHAGRRIASAADDLTIRYWNVEDGRPLGVLAGHQRPARSLMFSQDDSRLLSVADDRTLRVWVPNPAEGVTTLRGHSSFVYGAEFTPDGSRIVSAGWDHAIRTWDSATGRQLAVFDGLGDYITAVAVSPDSRWIAAAFKLDEWRPSIVTIRDAQTGEDVFTRRTGRGEVGDLVFSRDGTRLWLCWQHGGAGVLDLATREVKVLIGGTGVRSLAISPDERLLAAGTADGTILLADARTGEVRNRFEGHTQWVASLNFHPSLPELASAATDKTVRLWNLETGECRATLDSHWDKVYATAYSPDGTVLATGSNDTTIIIWDAAHAEELTRLKGHQAYVYSLAFSPDGSQLVSASGDTTVRIWDTRPVHYRLRADARGSDPGVDSRD